MRKGTLKFVSGSLKNTSVLSRNGMIVALAHFSRLWGFQIISETCDFVINYWRKITLKIFSESLKKISECSNQTDFA